MGALPTSAGKAPTGTMATMITGGLVGAVASLVTAASILTGGGQAATEPVVTGMHVPWAIGGEKLDPQGRLIHAPAEWPADPVQAIRLWDTRTAWLNLEPAHDKWNWAGLDAHIRQAHSRGVTDITLVLAGTPKWAAASLSPNDAPWLGTGSASEPANLRDWDEYVQQVATRYKGQITSYEIWNEQNSSLFWRGSAQTLAQMTKAAMGIIHAVDPTSTVLSGGVVLSSPTDVSQALPYWQALKDAGVKTDATAIHWYPQADSTDGLYLTIMTARAALTALGFEDRVWLTETGVLTQMGLAAEDQIKYPARITNQARQGRVERVYWYAWSKDGTPGLEPVTDTSALGQGIRLAADASKTRPRPR